MVISTKPNVAFITLTCVLLLHVCTNLMVTCNAWTTTAKNTVRTTRSSSESITNTPTAVSASSYSATITATTNELTIQQRKKLIQSALSHARKTDQTYGLAAPESIHAWSLVDELYMAIPEYSSAVEESVRRVFGEKQKSVWDL